MRCPNCGVRARGEIPFCPRCGQMLPEPQGGYSPIPESRIVICSNCGYSNPAGTRYCSFCGQLLRGTTLWKRKGTWLAVIVLISLCSMFISTRLISTPLAGEATPTSQLLDTPYSTLVVETPLPVTSPEPLPTLTPRPRGQPEVGALAPDFTLIDAMSGEVVTLSYYTGQPVLVTFWTTWCNYCLELMPAIQEAHNIHQADGLVILAVNVEESRSSILDYANNLGLTFNLLLDSDGSTEILYRVQGFPTSFFINRNGIIAAIHIGSMTEDYLEGYLSEIIQ